MKIVDLIRVMVINFIASLLITVIVCWGLVSIHADYLVYLGALLGMYVFAGYGVNSLIDQEIIPNKYNRFVIAFVCIIIYSWVFVHMMPVLFGPSVFDVSNVICIANVELNTKSILSIFAVIVLIINYLDYRKG